jgi:hypothetical protein
LEFIRLYFCKKFEAFLYGDFASGGMHILLDFPQNWIILFFAFLGIWAMLMIIRKRNGGKKEVKEQIYLAASGLFSLFLMEVFATQSDLWHYVPGDWPVILWPTYVAAILFGYQLLRFIEDRLTTKRMAIN